MKAKSHWSPKLEERRKQIELKTRIFVLLQMSDYKNWKNGEYLGDMDHLIKLTHDVLTDVFEWVDDGMPGKGDLDLQYYNTIKSSPFANVCPPNIPDHPMYRSEG